jgi:hypothetical protein
MRTRQKATPSVDQLWALPPREWCLSLPLTSPGNGPISKKTGCNVVRLAVFIIKLRSFTYRLLSHYLRYDLVILIELVLVRQYGCVGLYTFTAIIPAIHRPSLALSRSTRWTRAHNSHAICIDCVASRQGVRALAADCTDYSATATSVGNIIS